MGIKECRETFAKAFKDDPGFRMSYLANIALLIYDDQRSSIEGRSHEPPTNLNTLEGCNNLASRLIELIFEKP